MPPTDQLSEKVNWAVELQKEGVTDISNVSQPSEILNDGVELMSMGNEQPPAIDRRMKGARLDGTLA